MLSVPLPGSSRHWRQNWCLSCWPRVAANSPCGHGARCIWPGEVDRCRLGRMVSWHRRPQLLFRFQLFKVLVMALVIYPLTVSYGIVGTSVAVTISAVAVQIVVLATAVRTLDRHWSVIPRTLEVPFAGTDSWSARLFSCERSFSWSRPRPLSFCCCCVDCRFIAGSCYWSTESGSVISCAV